MVWAFQFYPLIFLHGVMVAARIEYVKLALNTTLKMHFVFEFEIISQMQPFH